MVKKTILLILIIILLAVTSIAGLNIIKNMKGETPSTEEQTVEIKVEEEDIEAAKPQSSLSGKVICIDPGHGKTSRSEREPIYPGAGEKKATNVSGAVGAVMTEEALNLEVGLKLKKALEDIGAVVKITRTTHECSMSNVERAEFANSAGSDMVVRIHADGSNSKEVSGASMLVPSKKRVHDGYLTDDIVLKSRRAGELVLTKMCEKTGAKNRGIVERPDMTGFNWSSVPVILLEMGFMSNPEEEAKMADGGYQDKIVAGIIEGLEIYFNE